VSVVQIATKVRLCIQTFFFDVRLPRSPCAYSSDFQKSEHSSITTSHFSDILFFDASERRRIFRKEGLHARQSTAGVQFYFLVIRGATCFLLSSNTQTWRSVL